MTLRTLGHAVRNHVATGKRGVSRELVIDDLDQVAQPVEGDSGAHHENAARVAAILDRLPADMRELLMGRFFDELSYAELALRMDRSEGALRVLYTRTLRRLREEMNRDAPN